MYRVLVVDDEPFILEGLRHIINWEDYDLEIAAQAANGIEAVNILESSPSINILITDIKMPKMNGIELIKYVKEKGLNVKCIVLSGYDDFAYVKEAAVLGVENYLLKPVDISELIPTLQNTLMKIENELYNKIAVRKGAGILKENILNRWVSGYISEDELIERAAFLGINLEYKHMLIALIKPLVSPNDTNVKISDKNLLRFAINNIASQIMEENKRGLTFQDLDGDIVLLFSSSESNLSKQHVEDTLKQCMQSIQTYMDANIFITVGNLVEKFTELDASYKNAKSLQDYCFIYPGNHIVQYEETKKILTLKESSLHIDTTPLKNSVTSKDKNGGKEFIQKVYGSFMENDNITPAFIRNYTIEVLFTITSAIKSIKSSADELPNDFRNLLSYVSEMKNVKEIKNWLCDVFDRCIDFLNDEEEKLSPIVKKLLNYIQSNYNKDMNLKTLASEFNISSIYLGQLFKNELGDTFTNYLNKLRIEKAKSLLQSTNMKVNEISEEVGYLNANYFFTIFKKLTGVSPVEYRS